MTMQFSASDPAESEWPQEELESVSRCPVCQHAERTVRFTDLTDRVFFCAPGKWTLYLCDSCGAGYLDPRPTPESISQAYAKYYTHAESDVHTWYQQKLSFKFRMKRELYNGYLNAAFGYRLKPAISLGKYIIPCSAVQKWRAEVDVRHLALPAGGGCVLDVGCGNGEFLIRMKSYGWQVHGVDFDPVAVESAKSIGIDARLGTLEQAEFKPASYDAVTLSHVIEHLHDPVGTMRQCFEVLKPGGTLWIATPNIESSGCQSYGSDWRGLEPPRHLTLFTVKSLKLAAELAGFEFKAIYGSPESKYFYMQSTAISQGKDPYSNIPISREVAAQLCEQDRCALRDARTSDIITLIARRPA
jgi:2-polyprenyl-3-methyl-5-hydroxy-6-metoxy-1,4-benzoquinol methylase